MRYVKLSLEDLKEELSKDNLMRFKKGLYIDDLSSEGKDKLRQNLKLMYRLSQNVSGIEKGKLSKDMVLDLIELSDGVLSNVLSKRREELKPYLSQILKIKGNFDTFLSQYRVQPEILDTEDNTELQEKELEFETQEEEYNYYLDKAIEKIERQFGKGKTEFLREKDRGTGSMKDRAETDARIYIYSDGNVKPIPPKNVERELYDCAKEFYNEWKNKVSHVLENEELSEKDRELTPNQKLNKYIDKVSEIVLEAEEERERRKDIPLISTKKKEKEVQLYTTN